MWFIGRFIAAANVPPLWHHHQNHAMNGTTHAMSGEKPEKVEDI
jgi:hypothetical protein